MKFQRSSLLSFSEERFTLELPPTLFVQVLHPSFFTWFLHSFLVINFLHRRGILFYLVHIHSYTRLPPINFNNCTKSLLWKGNGTHRHLYIYPMQCHMHSKWVCNTKFVRTNSHSMLYVHPKTVYFLIFFWISFRFCTLYSINVNPRHWRPYVFEEMVLTGHTSYGELNFNKEGVCYLL